MNIGIPKEIKPFEGRVALTPKACAELIGNGHTLYMEHDAGVLSGFSDEQYENANTTICHSNEALYKACELIVKVKEPIEEDLKYLTSKHTLFCFLHLAANTRLVKILAEKGLTAVAFESVVVDKQLPLLKPMSEIAGKLAVQIGSNLLHLHQGGQGVLLGGLSGAMTDKGHVLVAGAGSAGTQAALLAKDMGANVFVFDKYQPALERLAKINPDITLISNESDCLALLPSINLLIGALLVAGKKTPCFISREQLKLMQKGSVIVDISVDQGGCIETTRPTTYSDPTYTEEGITHFCVGNMPGAVPRTATQALSALLPEYIQRLTLNNWYENDNIMRNAVNIRSNKVLIGI
ncbi:MAG: alanine dehydrogenase [Cycloclasticus sp. symbiont of Poecilosclerida sp. N]|nr:MAG: alanine dehydrogenase [Cycloclasticus sp. symbiont of Poecilosclerida sp. N]